MNALIGIGLSILVVGIIVYLLSGDWRTTFNVIRGWTLYELWNGFFDYVVWPITQARYGDTAILPLSVLALINNLLILRWYLKKGNDWMGFNLLEDFRHKSDELFQKLTTHKNWFAKIGYYVRIMFLKAMIWLVKLSDATAFLILSICKDSCVTTAYLRHGRFGQMERRDYKIFLASTVIGCLAWGLGVKIILLVIGAIKSYWF